MKNIIQGKPVPAIFWYKKAEGPSNNYSILDGKQRLESIILYIGASRAGLKIDAWHSYIFGKARDDAGFKTIVDGTLKSFSELTDPEVVKLRDYPLSIIEIDFDEETTLDEIIGLFVDINQYGIKVSRFQIVRALYLDDPFLKQVLGFIAIQKRRSKDAYFKAKNSCFTYVLNRLDIVKNVDHESRVDLMWERLIEFALFTASGTHRKPSQILKDFISRRSTQHPRLTAIEHARLRGVFDMIKTFHRNSDFTKTRWATNQTHFYILVVTLLSDAKDGWKQPQNLAERLVVFDNALNGSHLGISRGMVQKIREYAALSAKQTTDATKRSDREKLFQKIVRSL